MADAYGVRGFRNLGIVDDVVAWIRWFGVYGYFGGGYTGANLATTDRIVFSTSVTSANTVSNLATNRRGYSALSDTSLLGYFCGGNSSTYTAVTDIITFSTGVTAGNTASNITSARNASASLSDGSTYGYNLGGQTSSGARVTTSDRVVFSTSVTSANTVSNMVTARYVHNYVSDGLNYGYTNGGITGTGGVVVATAERLTFSSGANAANTVSNLSAVNSQSFLLSDNYNYGYFCGGYSGTGGVPYSATDRITFSTGANAANTVSNLGGARTDGAGVSDGAGYGYMGGGVTNTGAASDRVATTEKMTYSTGTVAASTVSNLSASRYAMGGSGISDGAV